jgi:hypothetical protein
MPGLVQRGSFHVVGVPFQARYSRRQLLANAAIAASRVVS